jgi:hypothetical protein
MPDDAPVRFVTNTDAQAFDTLDFVSCEPRGRVIALGREEE